MVIILILIHHYIIYHIFILNITIFSNHIRRKQIKIYTYPVDSILKDHKCDVFLNKQTHKIAFSKIVIQNCNYASINLSENVVFMRVTEDFISGLQNRVPKVRVLVPLPNDKVLKT